MSNQYDRVFKEVFTGALPGLLRMKYDMQAIPDSQLPLEFTGTYERRVDHLSRALDQQGNEWIIHFEFQTRTDHTMIYRMQRYHAEILFKYKLPIRHIVLQVRGRANNKTKLEDNKIFRGYELINLDEISVEFFRNSKTPDIILLGILANFNGLPEEDVISDLIDRIVKHSNCQIEINHHMEQLMILSRIPKLESVVSKKLEHMPLDFDIKVDEEYFTKLGETRGETKAFVKMFNMNCITAEEAAVQLGITTADFLKLVRTYTLN